MRNSSAPCCVPSCDRAAGDSRGMCRRHYKQWLSERGSDYIAPNSADKTLDQRFWDKADKSGGPDTCWLWTAGVNNKGYGLAYLPRPIARELGSTTTTYAHRLAWELTNGQIPAGAYVDHMCYTPHCINPAHLRLVTPKGNMENRSGASRISKTGVRGVYPGPKGRYVAQAQHKHIGTFDTIEEAAEAVRQYRAEHMPDSLRDKVA